MILKGRQVKDHSAFLPVLLLFVLEMRKHLAALHLGVQTDSSHGLV